MSDIMLHHLIDLRALLFFAYVLFTCPLAHADVHINEIFYHSPNDLNELEFIELLNDGITKVALGGWELTNGVKFTFPSGAVIRPNEYIVVCNNKKCFSEFYGGIEPIGEFEKALSNRSEKIHLKNADGKLVEAVEYGDRAPWPVSADGYSASLERICPSSATDAANWAPSELSDDYETTPSGTPGRQNSVYQALLPPDISEVVANPNQTCLPGALIDVHATVTGAQEVTLCYRVVQPGGEGEEVMIEMHQETKSGDRYRAAIPGQIQNRIVRLRVRATGISGATRYYPHENALRPARSIYVAEPIRPGKMPIGQFFNVGVNEFKKAERYREAQGRSRGQGGRRPGFAEEDRARVEARRALQAGDLTTAWSLLTLKTDLSAEKRGPLRVAFRRAHQELAALRDAIESSENILSMAETVSGKVAALGDALRASAASILNDSQQRLLDGVGIAETQSRRSGAGRRDSGALGLLKRALAIEPFWFDLVMDDAIDDAEIDKLHGLLVAAIAKRDATRPQRRKDGIPDLTAILQTAVSQREALYEAIETVLGQDRYAELHLPEVGDQAVRRPRISRAVTNSAPLPPQGRSAFIYTDPETGATQLFDFVNISQRKSGYKVRLHKDRPLNGMTSINVLYEADESALLNEALAYDLYRVAGNATQRAGYLRLMMDGHLAGYHLWFEQPNGAFFRHRDIDDGGNLYKLIWQGTNTVSRFTPEDKIPMRRNDIVRRYEKKTNLHDGYDDLIALIENLESTQEKDVMWQLIQDSFDVDQVINYYAVSAWLSHWDGYNNNYFLYHDTKRKKWTIYPWDQDLTWSQRTPVPEDLYEMPLNFGAEGATPPPPPEGVRDGRQRKFGWWSPGSEISRPLLANPQFYDRYLKRLKELCETVFTEERFGPRMGELQEALEIEVWLQAQTFGQGEESGIVKLRGIMESLRKHLSGRRGFVLKQTAPK